MNILLTAIGVLLACVAAQPQSFTSDTVLDDWAVISANLEANGSVPVFSSTFSNVRGYGGERTMTASISQNFFGRRLRCNSLGSSFSMVMGSAVLGSCELNYSAPDGLPYNPPINLNTPTIGASCWVVSVFRSTGGNISISTQTATGSVEASFPSFSSSVQTLCMPIPNPSALTSVTGVQVTTAGLSASTINFNVVCPSPTVICTHKFSIGGQAVPVPAQTGDTISVTLTCTNFVSVPATDETVSVDFIIPQSIGTVIPTTRLCTFGQTFVPGANGISASNILLNDGASFMCTFDFTTTGGTASTPLYAAITNMGDGVVSYSGNAPRQICDVAQLFNLVVQDPAPSDEPPTNAPISTTEPPATTPPSSQQCSGEELADLVQQIRTLLDRVSECSSICS
mmetsp:Transcript_216/g.234  ORF Transcript_216/g.234 Transcript_216/m.234 type:complete len:398 (-) Transcript_216:99-1292(-)